MISVGCGDSVRGSQLRLKSLKAKALGECSRCTVSVAVLFCFIVCHISFCVDVYPSTSTSTSTPPGDRLFLGECQSQSQRLCAKLRTNKFYLVSLEIGPAAGGEALLAAEALQLAPHAQGIALHADFLAPGAHDLHVGRIFIWNRASDSGSDSGQSSGFWV